MQIMIVGAGQVGHALCEKFSIEGQKVILVDRDENTLKRIERELNIMTVCGNGASAKILAEAGIAKTDLFIAVTNSDEVNLVACYMSRQYEVKTRIARVRGEDFLAPNQSFDDEALGIDLAISPNWAMVEEIIKLVEVSAAFDTADFVDGKVALLGYQVPEDHQFIGLTLQELKQQHDSHPYIMTAIIRQGETIIPHGHDTIKAGDKIYLMIRKGDLATVEKLFGFYSKLPKLVFIIGGGDIGYLTARHLEELGIEIKLVEDEPTRCEFLSENLARTMVLCADGLDAQGLLEEDIDQADLVITVTDSDTTNILASLLAKHHGTKRCITKITRSDFVPLLDKLGIDVTLSPRQVAADMILRYVRGGSTVSVATILDTEAEVVELTVADHNKFNNMTLKELALPEDALIGAIVREGEVVIPSGETIINPGDSLVIFFAKDASTEVETFFAKNGKDVNKEQEREKG